MGLMVTLQVLEDLEGGLAELYEGWSRHFGGDRGAAALFARLSVEEVGHKNIVGYIRRLVAQNMDDFVNVKLIEAARVPELLKEVGRYRGTEMAGITLPDAVGAAIRFERDVLETYYQVAVSKANPQLDGYIKKLGGPEHLGDLREFARERGFSNEN